MKFAVKMCLRDNVSSSVLKGKTYLFGRKAIWKSDLTTDKIMIEMPLKLFIHRLLIYCESSKLIVCVDVT